MSVIRCSTLNPVRHYGLETGLLQPGDSADFIIIDSPETFNVQKTFIGGELVAESGISLLSSLSVKNVNAFDARPLDPADLKIPAKSGEICVMKALEGQLITEHLKMAPTIRDGFAVSDPERDLIKIVVLNRYQPSAPAVGFITNTGLKRGALASSVAHDSHNIVAIGADDESLSEAINMIIGAKGGISLCTDERKEILPLPVAGIMTGEDGFKVAGRYEHIDALARNLGITLTAPYMTLSFMALLVIPELKLSDKGLFDGLSFSFTSLFPQ
jgi:adenine deaminase